MAGHSGTESSSGQGVPAVQLRGIAKSFAGRQVVAPLDLDIHHGEFLTLLGPSGCGKTTVLRLIAGFEQPDAGQVCIDGRDVTALPPELRPVNTVFQSYALFPHLGVAENVAFGLRMQRLPKAEIDARVQAALAQVQLTGLGARKPHQLSGGQQQRVALARALVLRPRVLLLDESLSALDYKLRKQMQLELKSLQRELGITFVFVTHDQEEALAMSDRVALMNEGRLLQLGSPRDIYERPASLFAARFVGEANVFPGTVRTRNGSEADVEILGKLFSLPVPPAFAPGAAVQVMLRPEDMRIYSRGEAVPAGQEWFEGRIIDRTYKGTTLDSQVDIGAGRPVIASEFFDEDAPEFDHPVGEAVRVTWVPGWEVVLPGSDA